MPADPPASSSLEIAHVLFIDIVGYSKLLTSDQRDRQLELNRIVRETEAFRAAEVEGKLIRIPTGDGMVLAFFTKPDAPARCAMAISRALHGTTHLPLRMGIHSGPVELVEDVNDKSNLAGAGVNTAQRVMDCADAGHILLSARSANDLAEHAEWKAQLHELGEVEVKHGVRVRVANLYSDGFGNAAVPQKLRRQRLVRRRRLVVTSVALATICLAIAFGFWAWQRQAHLRAQAAAEAEAAAKRVKSVAVLPFESVGPDEQNALLAGGVHREVLSNLAKVADLKVISRTSVMRYKPGAERNLKEIGGQLDVAYIVEGTVQREGNKVRVTADLIDTGTDAHVWSETYDGEVAEVLRIQAEIAQRISNQLGAKLSPRERTDLASKPTQDLAAFENYIRARALMETIADVGSTFFEDYVRAVQLLEQAVARDPQFAAGYWALSDANIQLFHQRTNEATEYRDRAEAALQEAQRLAPEAGETIYAEARVIYYGYRDFKRALATLEQAAKSLPNNAEISLTRALLYRRFGRWQEAYEQFVRASELNPQEPFAYVSAAWAATQLRWWDEGDRIRERMVRLFPRLESGARLAKAFILCIRGEMEAGNRELDSLNPTVQTAFLPLFFRAFGDRNYAEARRLVNEAAKYPDLQADRWRGEVRLAVVANLPPDQETTLAMEKQLEERVGNLSKGDEADVIEMLACVKMILGKKKEAIRLREEYVAKHSVSEDAVDNVLALGDLALAYAMAGEDERALETLAKLVKIPSMFGYGLLKQDPTLERLRKDPRFDEILKQSQQPFPRL